MSGEKSEEPRQDFDPGRTYTIFLNAGPMLQGKQTRLLPPYLASWRVFIRIHVLSMIIFSR